MSWIRPTELPKPGGSWPGPLPRRVSPSLIRNWRPDDRPHLTPEEIERADAAYRHWWLSVLTLGVALPAKVLAIFWESGSKEKAAERPFFRGPFMHEPV
jgi:hypothetical protein